MVAVTYVFGVYFILKTCVLSVLISPVQAMLYLTENQRFHLKSIHNLTTKISLIQPEPNKIILCDPKLDIFKFASDPNFKHFNPQSQNKKKGNHVF